MIDLHSHILPDLDDGARSIEEALVMARMAVDSGVTAMAATPHCAWDRRREVHEVWKLLRQALEDYEIPLKLYRGMEIFGTPETAELLAAGKLFTLNGSRYPLIEFDFRAPGEEAAWILYSVREAGFRPVVAHPERYDCVRSDPGLINHWYSMGCLLQVNRGSLLGRFGGPVQDMAGELVDRGFAAVVASDAHSPRMRTPWMEDVWQLLSAELSPEKARQLLRDNPARILKDEELPPAEPEWF